MNLRDVYSFIHHVSLRACPVPGTGPGPGDQGPGEVIKLMMTDGGGEKEQSIQDDSRFPATAGSGVRKVMSSHEGRKCSVNTY